MLPSSSNHLLVDEGQLGQLQPGRSRYGDRADFRLHLALLTDAVEEQPWFDAKPAVSSRAVTASVTLDRDRAEVLVKPKVNGVISAITERFSQQGEDRMWWLSWRERRRWRSSNRCWMRLSMTTCHAGAGAVARKAGRYARGSVGTVAADPRIVCNRGWIPGCTGSVDGACSLV